MTRDPLAGVQTALEEARDYFEEHADGIYVTGPSPSANREARLLTEVEVGLTLLREVRERKAA